MIGNSGTIWSCIRNVSLMMLVIQHFSFWPWSPEPVLCKMLPLVTSVSVFVSTLSITAIALDRSVTFLSFFLSFFSLFCLLISYLPIYHLISIYIPVTVMFLQFLTLRLSFTRKTILLFRIIKLHLLIKKMSLYVNQIYMFLRIVRLKYNIIINK